MYPSGAYLGPAGLTRDALFDSGVSCRGLFPLLARAAVALRFTVSVHLAHSLRSIIAVFLHCHLPPLPFFEHRSPAESVVTISVCSSTMEAAVTAKTIVHSARMCAQLSNYSIVHNPHT
jgi:hypothetical protein